MVSVLVPGAAVGLTLSVRAVRSVVGFGAQSAVTPLGKPETDKVTLPVNPYCALT